MLLRWSFTYLLGVLAIMFGGALVWQNTMLSKAHRKTADLSARLDALKSRHEGLRDTRLAFDQALAERDRRLSEMAERVLRVEAERDEARTAMQHSEAALAAAREAGGVASAAIAMLEHRVSEARRQADDAATEIRGMAARNQTLRDELDRLRAAAAQPAAHGSPAAAGNGNPDTATAGASPPAIPAPPPPTKAGVRGVSSVAATERPKPVGGADAVVPAKPAAPARPKSKQPPAEPAEPSATFF